MRKKYFFVLMLLLALLIVGCGSSSTDSTSVDSEPTTSTDTNETYTIGLVMKTLTNPFFVEMEKGARQAEEELGIELVVRTGSQETSVDQQINIIDELIADGVDAIVIAPADSVALIPVLKKAQDAGIILVNIDNQIDPEEAKKAGLVGMPFISVDNKTGGYLSAKYVSDQITTPSQAIILEGIQTAANANDRKDGALRAFAENDNIEVVGQETANWKIDEAYDVTGQLLTEHPNVTVIFAANDMMALGSIEYLKENNRTDVMVAGYDALEEAKEAIRTGDLQVTIDQQAALQGFTGVETAVQLLDGQSVDNEVYVDVMVVSSENLTE